MHFLWTDRQRKFFSAGGIRELGAAALCTRFRRAASLDRRVQRAYNSPRSQTQSDSHPQRTVTAAVHRFEESIAGRPYLIEVAAVSQDRWRAYIVRIPGVPTALMPFYGRTPAEAAQPAVRVADARARSARRTPPGRCRIGAHARPGRPVRRLPLARPPDRRPRGRSAAAASPSSARPTSTACSSSRRRPTRPGAPRATASCRWRRSPTAAGWATSTSRRSSSSR